MLYNYFMSSKLRTSFVSPLRTPSPFFLFLLWPCLINPLRLHAKHNHPMTDKGNIYRRTSLYVLFLSVISSMSTWEPWASRKGARGSIASPTGRPKIVCFYTLWKNGIFLLFLKKKVCFCPSLEIVCGRLCCYICCEPIL
jgi:hypothetical protein